MDVPRFARSTVLETLAMVARTSPTSCRVVFRGTKNAMNVLEDIAFFPRALPGCADCRVHSGFDGDWRSLSAELYDALTALNCQNSTLALSGHSLGSAISVFAAYDLTAPDAPWNVSRVYTYGQPRVGNEAFAKAFSTRIRARAAPYYRVVDYRDAVPHLPTQDMFAEGWSHAMPEVYYNQTALGEFVVCNELHDRRCSYQWSLPQTLAHTCDHCSYLGMNPCACQASLTPECTEP